MDIHTIKHPSKPRTTTVNLTTKLFQLWYLTSMDWEQGLKWHATTWVSRYTWEGPTPLKPFWWPSRTGTTNYIKSGVIYRFKCPPINCLEEYIGELGRSFGDLLRENLRATSPKHQHSHSKGHLVSPNCFSMVNRESRGVTKKQCTYKLMTPHSIGTWASTNCHTFGTTFTGHTIIPAQIAQLTTHPTHTWTPPNVYHTTNGGHMQLQCW